MCFKVYIVNGKHINLSCFTYIYTRSLILVIAPGKRAKYILFFHICAYAARRHRKKIYYLPKRNNFSTGCCCIKTNKYPRVFDFISSLSDLCEPGRHICGLMHTLRVCVCVYLSVVVATHTAFYFYGCKEFII